MQHANSENLNCISELSHYCWNEVKREESAYYLYLRKKKSQAIVLFTNLSGSVSFLFFLSAGFNLSIQLSSLHKDIRLHWTGWSMKAEDEKHKREIKVAGDRKRRAVRTRLKDSKTFSTASDWYRVLTQVTGYMVADR